ncbi:metalloregulator ArsR/SmtB family transcription factor [Rathayibacter festucae]|uniref:ArsR/SmtB family transcription factor n=1 Tax=Rathayibacter TaxID=33886 RepID=UPI000CE7A589|nr:MULTISPECIES: metalloregulator ArsR/SmtB family transcription factor [Rathayibacter]MCJ1702052.1 metalloregulator ArsR/SmtB family transcription factor [Rathayibacter festucae]PPG64406.1 transcriptional regulator [Rathayibacter sp. AY2B7]
MPIDSVRGTSAAVSLFHSLADPKRLQIVRRLRQGEARVSDLVAELGVAQSTASEHMSCLRECGLVVGRAEGRQVFYSLARPELIDLLESAEALLEATGFQVDLCGMFGTDSRDATDADAASTVSRDAGAAK